jgi:hypothetical protein
MALDLIDELERVLEAFDHAAIEYALCGSLSLEIHGYPRATMDIDVLLTAEQVTLASATARAIGFDMPVRKMVLGLRAGTPCEMLRLSKLDPESGVLMSLDLVVVGPGYEEVWTGKTKVPWRGRDVPVVSRDGLALMKRLAARPQDLADLAVLEGTNDDEA